MYTLWSCHVWSDRRQILSSCRLIVRTHPVLWRVIGSHDGKNRKSILRGGAAKFVIGRQSWSGSVCSPTAVVTWIPPLTASVTAHLTFGVRSDGGHGHQGFNCLQCSYTTDNNVRFASSAPCPQVIASFPKLTWWDSFNTKRDIGADLLCVKNSRAANLTQTWSVGLVQHQVVYKETQTGTCLFKLWRTHAQPTFPKLSLVGLVQHQVVYNETQAGTEIQPL